jgi:hypothetical protein
MNATQKETARIAKCFGLKLAADDKVAVKTLETVYSRYIEARGSLPSIGITNSGRVNYTATDGTLAQFSSLEIARCAVSVVERAVAARVRQLSADSI